MKKHFMEKISAEKASVKSSAPSESYQYLKPCSAQDMTGLIPSGPSGEDELENYEELYPFLPKVPTEGTAKAVKKEP